MDHAVEFCFIPNCCKSPKCCSDYSAVRLDINVLSNMHASSLWQYRPNLTRPINFERLLPNNNTRPNRTSFFDDCSGIDYSVWAYSNIFTNNNIMLRNVRTWTNIYARVNIRRKRRPREILSTADHPVNLKYRLYWVLTYSETEPKRYKTTKLRLCYYSGYPACLYRFENLALLLSENKPIGEPRPYLSDRYKITISYDFYICRAAKLR